MAPLKISDVQRKLGRKENRDKIVRNLRKPAMVSPVSH